MEKHSRNPTATSPALLGETWFDPIERGIRDQIRGFIEALLQQDGLVRFGLGVAGEHDGSSISRGQVHIDHLDGCHLLQHCARRPSRRQSLQPLLPRDLQAIREEGDKDVRFDARLGLV